ncbi:MAG: right-handed parallel beta-helix repeat-containing protein, partial [Woeseiaceae bacterium]
MSCAFNLCFLLAAGAALGAQNDRWTPPIGIPEPPFGIHETHTMYAGMPGYHEADNGPYSIYVDNSAPNCSDSGPATAQEPRCSIPVDLSVPGSVVEVHGSRYDYGGADVTIDANGTEAQPVFLRGVDDGKGFPSIFAADNATLQGRYFVVENFYFDRSQVRNHDGGDAKYGRSYISMRNLEIANHPRKNGSVLSGSNVVFYRNHVHHNQQDDRHGTAVRPGADHIWIVDNHFHHNGGDAVQFCHGCRKDPPRNIFVGRNLMHGDRENAVDLKHGKNIVISQNTMHSYASAPPDVEWCFDDGSGCRRFSSGSDGSAIVIGSDGAPVNPWIIFNDISDSNQGIRIEEVYGAWIIGNTIHNIAHRAVALEKDGNPLYIIGNTVYGAEFGIDQYWRKNFTLNVHNNIFANMREASFRVGEEVAGDSTVDNNVFWNGGEPVEIEWGGFGESVSSSREANALFRSSGNIVGNPLFADPASGEFSLLAASVAIDSGNSKLELQNT